MCAFGDHCQFLGLPLVDLHGSTGECVQQLRRIGSRSHKLAELRTTQAFPARCGEEHFAPLAHDVRRRGQALDSLVESQIQGISAGRRDYRVSRLPDIRQGRLAHEFHALCVSRNGLASEYRGDRPGLGQRHVHHEVVPREGGDLQQFAVQRVVGEGSLGGLGVPHVQRAVETLDRSLSREADRNQLASAGKSGHQVRLDESERDTQVGIDESPVDEGLRAPGGLAEEDLLVDLARPVRVNRMSTGHLRPDDLQQLVTRCFAMKSGRDEDLDFVRRDAASFQSPDYVREYRLVRCRTGDVADRDRGTPLALGQLFEGRASDRMPHGFRECCVLVREAGREPGPQDLGFQSVRQRHRSLASVEC